MSAHFNALPSKNNSSELRNVISFCSIKKIFLYYNSLYSFMSFWIVAILASNPEDLAKVTHFPAHFLLCWPCYLQPSSSAQSSHFLLVGNSAIFQPMVTALVSSELFKHLCLLPLQLLAANFSRWCSPPLFFLWVEHSILQHLMGKI